MRIRAKEIRRVDFFDDIGANPSGFNFYRATRWWEVWKAAWWLNLSPWRAPRCVATQEHFRQESSVRREPSMSGLEKVRLVAIVLGCSFGATSCGEPAQLPMVEQQVKDLVLAANKGWVEAARTLDDGQLPKWFSGKALEEEKNEIAVGREHHFRIDYEPPEISFQSIRAAEGGGEATVVTQEGWAYRAIEVPTDKCLYRVNRNKTRVTYRLKLVGGGWSILGAEIVHLAALPAKEPCES